MKIAIISDIHGNSFALREVLDSIKSEGIEQILVLGDIVGYYYHPDVVIKMLADFKCTYIAGNHEVILKRSLENKKYSKEVLSKYGSGILQASEKLSSEQIEWLVNLPQSLEVVFDQRRFLICHGSPWDNEEYIYADCDQDSKQKLQNYSADYIFMGHTHHPYVNKERKVANVGSVGQLRSRGGVASWAMIETSSLDVVIHTIAYDATELIAEVKKVDPHVEYLHKVLTR